MIRPDSFAIPRGEYKIAEDPSRTSKIKNICTLLMRPLSSIGPIPLLSVRAYLVLMASPDTPVFSMVNLAVTWTFTAGK